ncbi:peptidoglycan/xylan/chitin deacetylase (PgdA/CDA1 family) [Kitasatospora sp. GP30]|uniref:polysaccharide deacetylase family protein n=1 Tax=Kitasatospora sp. GP30 TaxID=3035084 RepID=UPI000C6FEA05|nr:polysaccharide deacetylase family protein [Kitasatospora sp. GP30]MDH6139553.1 peptidoglycan/xylan/chitin deacetylase (PgdA/CDA1 family) [Kitasatospora sp. GP30]
MPVRTHRTVLRRAAAGGVAALTLALACACGPSSGGSGHAAGTPAAGPSGSASAGSASAGVDPSSSASTGDPTTTAGPTSGSPSGSPTGSTPTGSTPSGSAGTGGRTTPASPSADPAPATTAAAPRPAPDAPGTSIVYNTASSTTNGKTVALTFDDGPGPYTGQILDLLDQYHVKATFCEIGPQATANPALVKRIVADGHRLCDHTVHHPQPMHTLSLDKQTYEITAAKDMIVAAGGPGTQVSWFRAPGGDFSKANRQIAAQDGLRPLGWTVDTRDWARPGVDQILANAKSELKPGGIILMHDGGGDRSESVAALAQLLPWLVQQGYTFDFPAG